MDFNNHEKVIMERALAELVKAAEAAGRTPFDTAAWFAAGCRLQAAGLYLKAGDRGQAFDFFENVLICMQNEYPDVASLSAYAGRCVSGVSNSPFAGESVDERFQAYMSRWFGEAKRSVEKGGL